MRTNKTKKFDPIRRQRIKTTVLYILMAIGVFAIVFAVRIASFIGASEILIRWWN